MTWSWIFFHKFLGNILGSCPSCESKNILSKKGSSSCLEFSCQNCSEWTKEIYTSKELKNNSKGKSPFNINVRSVLAIREIGRGYSALEKLCAYLNLSLPVQVNAFKHKNCFSGVQYSSIQRLMQLMSCKKIRMNKTFQM